MNKLLQAVAVKTYQLCRTYPGGIRAMFAGMRERHGLSESSVYADLNPNNGQSTLRVWELVRVMEATGEHGPLRELANWFGYSLASAADEEPDAPTLEAEALQDYATAYPGVNVMGEFGKARAWCLSNPRQRKTKNGIRRFLNGWMDKAQNNASRSSPAAGSGRPMTARQVEAAERGDFAEQVLKLDEVYRNGELAAFGSGTQQGVCALSAAEARAGGIRVAGQDLGRRAG